MALESSIHVDSGMFSRVHKIPVNLLKRSGVSWLHFKVSNAIQV